MTLETSFERLELPLDESFRISRETTEIAETVVVRIDDGDGRGIGGVSPSSYYGEDTATVLEVLPDLLAVVEDVGDPYAHQRIERRLTEIAPDEPAARAAVTTALADLAATNLGVPLYRQWGLDPDAAPPTSYSLGIASPATMAERARERVDSGFDVLKLKLGTDPEDDRERVTAVREAVPDVAIRVDANGGYDATTAVEVTEWLAERDVEFIEQPVPGDDLEALGAVHERGSIPVAADESCVAASDVPAVAGRCSIVVGKLAKCGSPWALRRQFDTAAAHGLETMVGCMVESNVSLAAAMHCAPLADYADLDGSLLLADDPFSGVPFDSGRPRLERAGSGSGVRPRS